MSKTAGVERDGTVSLPSIPAKRYFTIGEVSDLCAVKPHVLRYWEQEFSQLKPIKRRGNRRYYQHHEVLLIRRIRQLLYEEGFTINGARNRLDGLAASSATRRDAGHDLALSPAQAAKQSPSAIAVSPAGLEDPAGDALDEVRAELESIRALLKPGPKGSSPAQG